MSIAAALHPYAATSAPATIGTVSAIGVVEVRGMKSREATLFSGDRIQSHDRSYVRVFLNDGHRIELASNTGVTLWRENNSTNISIDSGQLGFAASSMRPLQFELQSLTVVAEPGGTGSITYTSTDLVSIAAIEGKIKVTNRETGELFPLRLGARTVFGLHGKEPVASANSASGVTRMNRREEQEPTQQPPGQQPPATVKVPPPATGGLSRTTKILIFAGIGGAAAAIAAVAAGGDDNHASPSTPR
jgi:hypothetical protein